jgi:hypothetical protein
MASSYLVEMTGSRFKTLRQQCSNERIFAETNRGDCNRGSLFTLMYGAACRNTSCVATDGLWPKSRRACRSHGHELPWKLRKAELGATSKRSADVLRHRSSRACTLRTNLLPCAPEMLHCDTG